MSPGVQSLPVQFDNLNLRPTMPPPNAHQHPQPPPMGHLANLSPEFDTSLLRKEKESYEGYNFEKVVPQQPNEKATWALVTKTKMPISQNELRAMVEKQKRKGPSTAWNLLKSDEMKGFKRKQVDELISERMAVDPRFEHELVGLKLDQRSDRRGNRSTTAFQVILKRQLRKDLSNSGPAGLGKLHEPRREVVDLTGGSLDPSEGSGQDLFGRNSPPGHFMPSPHHGFPDPHGFEHPPRQPPFIHHQGPPMHEMHQEPHHGPPPPHHMPPHMPQHGMPHFEDPFVQPDHHQAQPPPPAPFPPFPPDMSPPLPHHEGHKEKHREAKGAKHDKGGKDMKPKIHQEKSYKSEKKHRKAHSESDWDYLSESSDSSRAYTDRTPDTSYSNSSSRKDYKRHGEKDRRRSSHGYHRDDHGNERHEPIYRVHRRKPVISPDRSRHGGGRPRYEAEDIEVIPASATRAHRPYLTRSRTSAHRPERFVETLERPAFHSRHMSYDDVDRHHQPYDFNRNVTPPSRRGSIYASKRTLALDLYDHREEQERQERLEREEIRRDLIRENARKEELRESVARQLERETEEARRRERMMGRETLWDERDRLGRWGRGYGDGGFGF
ncbi:MAG: hypothetical protein Q9209_003784 [Squamulea sp. 1 TL-2023]